jgi:hypothetical protein
MSMKAVVWALHQPDLSPAQKIVLLMLSHRHNPDIGCFPSSKKLAEDCNISTSSVFAHLAALEGKGLIKRKGRARENGQQTSNEYDLNMGVQNLDGGIQNLDKGYPKSGHPPIQNLGTNNHVIINHVNEPILFNDAWLAYPRKVGKGQAEKAWAKAIKKIDERQLCKLLSQYIDSLVFKDSKFIPHLSTWLNGERWRDDIEAPQQNGIDHMFRDMVNDLARVNR